MMKSIVVPARALAKATTNASGASRIGPFSRLRSKIPAMPVRLWLAAWLESG